MGVPYNIQFIISAFVAAFTIGGKAMGKGFARRHSGAIISILGKIVSRVSRKKE